MSCVCVCRRQCLSIIAIYRICMCVCRSRCLIIVAIYHIYMCHGVQGSVPACYCDISCMCVCVCVQAQWKVLSKISAWASEFEGSIFKQRSVRCVVARYILARWSRSSPPAVGRVGAAAFNARLLRQLPIVAAGRQARRSFSLSSSSAWYSSTSSSGFLNNPFTFRLLRLISPIDRDLASTVGCLLCG